MSMQPHAEFELWAAACEPAWRQLRAAKGRRRAQQIFAQLDPEQQWLVALWEVEAEVVNGGFSQLYCNGKGWMTPTAAIGLRELVMGDAAEVLNRAHVVGRRAYDEGGSCLDASQIDLLDEFNRPFWSLVKGLDSRVAEYLRKRVS
ncbi:MAG TPA: DUF4375 domain-containing protein [Phycisphaerales bacterium]|nr:DUF4375 domain-containing protein [Phycisphaerales bacterium]